MFELCAVLPQDHEQDASDNNAKAWFRSIEAEEIQLIADGKHPTPDTPKLVERIKRKLYLKELEEVVEYVGLTSQTVYNSEGIVIGDVFSESNSAAGGARISPKTLREPTEVRFGDTGSTVGQNIIAWKAGMRVLPRNTCKPQVWMDDPQTQLIVHENRSDGFHTLSEESVKILMRSNYRAPFGLTFCYDDDHWYNHQYLRRRSMQVVANILYISLERRDYERAWKSLSCLLREKQVDIRLLWMPALELLAWRHTMKPMSKTPDDFLDWLIVNFPKLPHSRPHMHKPRSRAPTFLPVAIMIKLANGKYKDALFQSEQAVGSAQYANNALCWALCGLARLKVNGDDEKVRRCFEKCLELGGVRPMLVACESDEEKKNKHNDNDSEDNNDSKNESESESDIHCDIETDDRSEEESENDDSMTAGNDSDSGPSRKKPRVDSSPISSSQPFFSQADGIGAEMGDSESDDDIL